MSQLLVKDEVELQSLLKQFLKSISEKIAGASSSEAAQEILLHLEETDKNFHSYEFVRYLRQYVESSLGAAVEEEMLNLTLGERQHGTGSGHDALINAVTCRTKDSAEYQQTMQTLKASLSSIVECLSNKYKEGQLRKEETHREREHSQPSSHFTDSCSDSDSSFNQSYAFITQEQLQLLAERLEPSKPKEMRREALHALCRASPSDLLSCESWSTLRRNLLAALNEAELSENALQFFAKSFSSSPLSVTREMFTSLAKNVESSFVSHKLNFPSGSATLDINTPKITRLLKQIRLINDFQKEVASFWIRHPEKYMEEVIESTLSLLCFHHPHGSAEKTLEPIHLLTLLDIKASWFIKWMHGYYSRNVVLRLLERKYKSLVVVAVQQCVHYSEASERFRGDVSDVGKQRNVSASQSSVYSGKELDFALFVHSVSVLGKLIVYSNGRKLFPIRIRKHKEPVTLTDLLVILINIMYHHPKPLHSDASHSDSLSPGGLVMELLWMLCEQPDCAAECLHQTAVMEKLLAPVVALQSGQQSTLKSPAATLTLIADILARIANTDRGLALFLYEENIAGPQGERACAAHIIAQFTLRLLGNGLPSLSGSAVSHSVCGAFIFVCWQMYNTCEGLQVLERYALHKAIASAWRKTSSLPERTSETSRETSSHEMTDELIWEETLLDSLLSFAATPRGLLLLQQTGALTQCVSYMFSRFTKKLQVSRCEKFGYGVMVTQVASTAPGIVALRDSGFIQELLVQLWSALECGSDDLQLAVPKPTSMDPIDRSCLKPFLSLVNLLSSSQSVWELLYQQPLPNKNEYSLREMPSSIPDLIDRLIAVNSDVKIHSLFHYEQSHTFGLRLLNVLCCSLDSFLLLENQYNICSMLLQSQRDNITNPDINEGAVIVDGLSVERNHVLVRVGVVGGPSERRLPLRSLQEGEQPYPWPMVLSYPVPNFYTLDPPEIPHTSQSCEISAFLTSSKDSESEESWLKKCQKLFCKAMMSESHNLTGNVLADLLESVVVHLSNSATECFFSSDQYKAAVKDVKNVELSRVEQLGVDICLRYGSYLKLLGGEARHHLILLLKQIKSFLSKHQRNLSSGLLTQQESYPGYDWLASSVFLIMGGDLDRSLGLLLRLSSLLVSAFIWPARIHACDHLTQEVAGSGIPPVYWCTAHYVEMLLKAELPLVHSAFRMSGFTPSQICLHWLTQCFWNYLDWREICLYLCTCVLFSPDYQVYLCVAILRHLQPDILQRTQSQELQIFLKEEPIQGFKIGDHLEFMLGLERSYRSDVLTAMKAFLKP